MDDLQRGSSQNGTCNLIVSTDEMGHWNERLSGTANTMTYLSVEEAHES